ncbi:MAG TPA: DUF5667 domain-containing protein [Anaerolineales bacterium]|nr:DUF5667 domain-containing protein [Anaerolineales bacterium]
MNNLYEALEVCLQEIELGTDIETSLLRYPDIADELRPILETSVHAKGLVVSVPSNDMLQRNRAKLLQRAAELRESQLKSAQTPTWFISLRRAAIALAIIAIAFVSGTGLVRASSTALPGDNLYSVKRTGENLFLLLTFDSQRRDSLEVEYETERLSELQELIAIGRSVEVDFVGIVTQQNGNDLLVAGVPVRITSQTELHDGAVSLGDAVRVFGITQSDKSVLAERIDQLPEGANLPDAGNSGNGSGSGSNSGSGSGDSGNQNDSSGPGNGNDNSNENNGEPGNGNDNINDSNSGPGGGNDNSNDNNSGPGGSDNSNSDSSGSESGTENQNNSGSGSSRDQSNDNGSEDNSGSGGGNDNSNEDNSGPGGGGGDD